jgi:hypothetical protein
MVQVELGQHLGGLGLQGRLPREQFLVTGRGRHTTIPPRIHLAVGSAAEAEPVRR